MKKLLTKNKIFVILIGNVNNIYLNANKIKNFGGLFKMKFSKILGFFTVIVFLAVMMTLSVSAQFDLGEFTQVENDDHLNGWMTGLGDLEFDTLAEAKYIYLEFNNPVETFKFILFGDGNSWGWPEATIEVNGTSVTINLTELGDYADLMEGSQLKILMTIAYDAGPTWEEVGLKKAVLLKEGESAAAPVETAAAASRGVDTLGEAAGGKNALMNATYIEGGEGFNDKEGSYSLFVYDENSEDFPKYCTNKAPYWASWKYDRAYIVDRIILRTANDNEQYPRRMGDGWTLSGSNDGSNWNVIYTGKEDDVINTNFQYYGVDIANSAAYQYYKLNSDNAASDQGDFIIQLSMVILCGSEAGAPVADVAPPAANDAPAVVTPPPAPSAPKVGDLSAIAFSAVMMFAAAGLVFLTKKTAK